MNELYILNGTKTLIYAVCLYDYKEEKIVLFQVSINNTKLCLINIEISKFELSLDKVANKESDANIFLPQTKKWF